MASLNQRIRHWLLPSVIFQSSVLFPVLSLCFLYCYIPQCRPGLGFPDVLGRSVGVVLYFHNTHQLNLTYSNNLLRLQWCLLERNISSDKLHQLNRYIPYLHHDYHHPTLHLLVNTIREDISLFYVHKEIVPLPPDFSREYMCQ